METITLLFVLAFTQSVWVAITVWSAGKIAKKRDENAKLRSALTDCYELIAYGGTYTMFKEAREKAEEALKR